MKPEPEEVFQNHAKVEESFIFFPLDLIFMNSSFCSCKKSSFLSGRQNEKDPSMFNHGTRLTSYTALERQFSLSDQQFLVAALK
jgi:hypothetical protein